MKRLEIVRKIDDILTHCKDCKTRKELNDLHGSTFSKIDGYCNKQCSVGQKLQILGKDLKQKGD